MNRCSICGRSWYAGDHDGCTRRVTNESHVAWFERTGHCGQCGQPGTYCLCTDTKRHLCGCHELHEVGSGLREAALDAFAETVVNPEQGELFA